MKNIYLNSMIKVEYIAPMELSASHYTPVTNISCLWHSIIDSSVGAKC
jgi:hypothetical protein